MVKYVTPLNSNIRVEAPGNPAVICNMNAIMFVTVFVAVLSISMDGKAQQIFPPSSQKLRAVAVAVSKNIHLDGKLTEPEWQLARAVTAFVQVEPNQGAPSEFHTEVRVLYNTKYLYVGVYCADPNGKSTLRAPDLMRDFAWRSHDTFAVCFDGFNDQRNSITFATNPFGAQKDYLSFDDTFFDSDWNGLWRVRTSRHELGWVVEMEIPWKTLRYPHHQDSIRSWNVNFLRLRRHSNEISVWSGYPRSFGFNRMEYAGKLDSLSVPPPSANIQVKPYFLISHHKQEVAENEKAAETKLKFGGEVKWAINANTVLDLTARTDFAQADADIQVNNLSRFSVFFPERRQFFLENASLFGAGLSGSSGGSMNIFPFFSRTIGLDRNGNPIPIDAGARYIHRSAERNYGAMVIRQTGSHEIPDTHFLVARYSENIAKQNRLGAMATYKSSSGLGEAYSNHAIGVDGFFRFDDANSLSTMLVRSAHSAHGNNGYAGYAQYLYTTNAIQAWLTESFITKSYHNEMGFVSRHDVISTSPGFISNLRGKWIPFKKWIRALQPDAMSEFYHQASTGKLIESSIAIYPFWASLHSGGFFGVSFTPNYQFLAEPFSPVGITIEPGTYRYTRSAFYAGSDPSKKISYTFQYDYGNYFDGQLTNANASLSYYPIPHISIKASFYKNDFSQIGLSESSASISLYTLEGRFAVNPRLQLNTLFQHNSHTDLNTFNVRLSWEYKPLSYVFAVFNSRETSGLERHAVQDGIIKVSYLKQF